MSRMTHRNIVAIILSFVLAFFTVCSYSEDASAVMSYDQLTPTYINSHMYGLAEEFSLEQSIIEMTTDLLYTAGILEIKNYKGKEKLFTKCQEFCIAHNEVWSGLIDIPFLYRLFDYIECSEFSDGEFARKNIGRWTRATKKDGSFFIGETDSNMNLINGVFFYADKEALYWGSFNNNKRNGTGCMLYPNDDCYNGAWRDDEMKGYGVYYFGGDSTGEYYGGYWENNKMNGEGTYVVNGISYKANWKDNVPIQEYCDGSHIYKDIDRL